MNAATLGRAAFLTSNDLGNVTAETQFSNGRSGQLSLFLPSNNSLANKNFRVRISGRVATIITTTFEARVYFGTSNTIATNTLIFDAGAQSVNSVTSSFQFWLDMTWTADGNMITGSGYGQMANNIIGQATLVNTPLSADPNRDSNTTLQSGAFYGFTLTGVFGNSSTGNHALIDSFDLEMV